MAPTKTTPRKSETWGPGRHQINQRGGVARRARETNAMPSERPRINQETAPSVNSDINTKHAIIRVAIDFGTTRGKVAFFKGLPGTKAQSVEEIAECSWGQVDDCYFPMIFCYIGSALIFGRGLQDALLEGKIEEDSVDLIRFPKLLLYEEGNLPASLESQAADTEEKLRKASKTLEEFLIDFFKELLTQIKQEIRASRQYGQLEPDDYEMQLKFSVPVLAGLKATRLMETATRKAGYKHREIVREAFPTISRLEKIMEEHRLNAQFDQTLLTPDSIVLVVDAGGGTADATSIKLLNPGLPGTEGAMALVGEPTSRVCGSSYVDREFLKYLRSMDCEEVYDTGGIAAAAAKIGITSSTFTSRALLAFEDIKLKPIATAWNCVVTIKGSKHSSFNVHLTRDQVEKFHRPVVEELTELIRANIEKLPETKIVFISGGFARSHFVLETLKKKFGLNDNLFGPTLRILTEKGTVFRAKNPVTTGMLLRYGDKQQKEVPVGYHFGLGVGEEYDPDRHPDATLHKGFKHPTNGKIVSETGPNPRIVQADPFDDRYPQIVSERWVPVLSSGAHLHSTSSKDRGTWCIYQFEGNQSVFKAKVYATMPMKAHDPILKPNGELRKGIMVWETFATPFDPQAHGFEYTLKDLPSDSEDDDEGKFGKPSSWEDMVAEVWYRVSLEWNDLDIKVKVEFAKKGTQPFDEEGEYTQKEEDFEVLHVAYVDIRTADKNVFPHQEHLSTR